MICTLAVNGHFGGYRHLHFGLISCTTPTIQQCHLGAFRQLDDVKKDYPISENSLIGSNHTRGDNESLKFSF